MRKGFIALHLILITCFWLRTLSAQYYRTNLEIPPVKVFSAMLKFAAKGQYAQINKSIKIISPLLEKIYKHFGVDLETELSIAVSLEDRTKISKAITKLVLYDVRDILYTIENAKDESGSHLLVWVKMSYIEYQLVSKLVKNRDQNSYRKIEENYDALYRWAEGLDRETVVSEDGIKAAKKYTNIIDTNLKNVFPEY